MDSRHSYSIFKDEEFSTYHSYSIVTSVTSIRFIGRWSWFSRGLFWVIRLLSWVVSVRIIRVIWSVAWILWSHDRIARSMCSGINSGFSRTRVMVSRSSRMFFSGVMISTIGSYPIWIIRSIGVVGFIWISWIVSRVFVARVRGIAGMMWIFIMVMAVMVMNVRPPGCSCGGRCCGWTSFYRSVSWNFRPTVFFFWTCKSK